MQRHTASWRWRSHSGHLTGVLTLHEAEMLQINSNKLLTTVTLFQESCIRHKGDNIKVLAAAVHN